MKASTLDSLSDHVTRWMGSTLSIALHTVLFIGAFGLLLIGIDFDKILLGLTTIVSLEAIYLSLFIQRSVSKQSAKLEQAVEKIVHNVSENLEQPLDEVVGEILHVVNSTHYAVIRVVAAESDEVIEKVSARLIAESDDVVREVSDQLKEETDDLLEDLKNHKKSLS